MTYASLHICERCWFDGEFGRVDDETVRIPTRRSQGHPSYGTPETCAFCGKPTIAGILVRADTALVSFPPDA